MSTTETFEPDAPLFLVGFMATGKTTVGRILAARLGWRLVDLDEVIAEEAGLTVPRIFEIEGEAGFRAREVRALEAVSRERKLVVATGGGAACREDNLRTMLAAGRVVALAITPDEAVRRARGGAGRPLLSGPDPVATAKALLEARAPFYARAHLSVDTVGRLPQDVARAVLAWVHGDAGAGNITVGVELGERRYDVRIGAIAPAEAAEAIAHALGAVTGVAVLVDEQVGVRSPRVAPLVEALSARLPNVKRLDLRAGETCKTLADIERTTQWLAEEGYDRRGAIVGVGGGAATDHAGFAASVYLRGVRFALVPTTLLAMVDASVGGKTAVDLPAGKNLVGAFHQPSAVVADLAFLETLPAREIRAGLAEVVKCGFIADAELLTILERLAPGDEATLSPAIAAELVARAVRVKAEVVAEDETESGRRAILNFGHTVGHALEAASGYGLLHGEAVGLGMLAALSLGEARGLGTPALTARARALLERLGLPVDLAPRLSAEVLARVAVDKKRRGGAIRFVFCPAAGETKLVDVSPEEIAAHFLSHLPSRDGGGARA